MPKKEWYYQYIDQIEKMIEEKHTRTDYCLWTMHDKENYMECWSVRHNEIGEYKQIIVSVNRQTGFISSYQRIQL